MEEKDRLIVRVPVTRRIFMNQHFPEISNRDFVSHIRRNRNFRFVKTGQKSLKMAAFEVPRGNKVVVLGPVGIHLANVEVSRLEYAVADAPWIAIISRFLGDKDSLTRHR
jgi:hypothetical protein